MSGIWPPRAVQSIDRPIPGTPVHVGSEFADSLVACWPFWEGAGGRIEDVIGGFHAGLQSQVAWSALGNFGPCQVWNNNAFGDLGSVPAPFQRTNNFAFECWFFVTINNTNQALFSEDSGAPYLRVNSSGKLELLRSQQASLVTGATTVTTGALHHAAVVVSPSNGITLFLDGNADGSGSGNPGSTWTGRIGLGVDNLSFGGGEKLRGALIRCGYYAAALSPRAIANLADPARLWELWRPPRAGRRTVSAASGGLLLRRRRALAV
jgi:hypothetical protein